MFESLFKKIKNYKENVKRNNILKRNVSKKPRAKVADSLWKKTIIAFVFLTIGVFVFYFILFRDISSGSFFKQDMIGEVARPATIKVERLSSILSIIRNKKEIFIDPVNDPINYYVSLEKLKKNDTENIILLEEKSVSLE